MPERFNFSALLLMADDSTVRKNLLKQIREVFEGWLGEPTSVRLLDCDGGKDIKRNWGESENIINTDLSESDLLFVYFDSKGGSVSRSVLSISRGRGCFVYTISLPSPRLFEASNDVAHLIYSYGCKLSSMGLENIVAAGGEMEIDASLNTSKDMLSSVNVLGSLVDWLCIGNENYGDLKDFYLIQRHQKSVVLKRRRPEPL